MALGLGTDGSRPKLATHFVKGISHEPESASKHPKEAIAA
jgi:hypothetical protein